MKNINKWKFQWQKEKSILNFKLDKKRINWFKNLKKNSSWLSIIVFSMGDRNIFLHAFFFNFKFHFHELNTKMKKMLVTVVFEMPANFIISKIKLWPTVFTLNYHFLSLSGFYKKIFFSKIKKKVTGSLIIELSISFVLLEILPSFLFIFRILQYVIKTIF